MKAEKLQGIGIGILAVMGVLLLHNSNMGLALRMGIKPWLIISVLILIGIISVVYGAYLEWGNNGSINGGDNDKT